VVDLGTDVSAWPDLDQSFALVSGTTAYLQAIARRLVTRAGSLVFHPSYGFDVRSLLNAALTSADLHAAKQRIEAQAEQDERTFSASCSLALNAEASRLSLRLDLETAAGPFSLVMAVDQVSATVLNQSA